MRKRSYAGLVLGAAVAALAVVPMAIGDGNRDLLRSGVAGSTPEGTPEAPGGPVLFGILPGGKPWVANRRSSIRVERGGEVNIKVRGLVIPGNVPPNPVTTLVASLVCNGVVVAMTDPVPFSQRGNATIDQDITVPKPCVAPVILFRPNAAPEAPYIGASG